MKLITTVDNNYGLLFNKRRISSDKAVLQKIQELSKTSSLLINSFSLPLFSQYMESDQTSRCTNDFYFNNICIKEDLLNAATDDDFCFIENVTVSEFMDRISELYIFKWNRSYPSDFKLDIMPNKYFNLKNTIEFAGNSHKNITMEVWTK